MKPNVLIGQSGGPTSVINSSLAGVVIHVLKHHAFGNVYGMRYGIEGFMNGEMVDFNQESSSVIEGLRKTPGSALGSSRHKLKEEDFPVILDLLKKHNIRYFFLIGGNDTMDTIHRVTKYCAAQGYELSGIGIPKTVDNDLFHTDHTPGYGSAARFNALSVQQAGRLACDMQRVDRYTVFQTVGRDAGWLAAASVLAKTRAEDAPHLIYMPERKLVKEQVVKDVKNIIEQNGWCSVVCGEGIVWEDGTPVSASLTKDRFSNVEFGAMGGSSAALNLHKLIHQETGYRGEFQIPESLPMCAIDRASSVDLKEAYACGEKAVELALAGESGKMVSIERLGNHPYEITLKTAHLKDVAVNAKPMPDHFINEAGNYVTEEFKTYAAPLAGTFEEFSVLGNLRK